MKKKSIFKKKEFWVNRTRAVIKDSQDCPKCGRKIGVLAGSPDAICRNCGWKDPCCE